MFQENTPYTHVVEFTSGSPTGVFSYSVYNGDGLIVAGLQNVAVPLPVGAISARIDIPASANAVSKPLFEKRTIEWTYPVSNGTINGNVSYLLQRNIPFPVTTEGVRALLGVTKNEIPDERVNLLGAYVAYRKGLRVDPDVVLPPYYTSGDTNSYTITRGIEAIAALELLPSLQLAIARRFDSGTNSYERFNKIDWEAVQNKLEMIAREASILVDPSLVDIDAPIIFMLSNRPDPLTGAA